MNYDPNKAIRQALMVARRQAAYGGQQSYPGYRPINPLTGLPEDEGVQVVGSSDARPIGGGISDGGNDPGTPGPPGAPSTGNFGRDVAGFAEAAGPALGGMAIGGLMGGPAGAVMGGVASTMAQGLAEATGLSNPASAPPGGFASVAGNIAQTQMGMQPTSNPVDAVTAAVTGPQAPADQEDADQGNAQAAADAAAAAAAAADNANSMSEAATADASADSDGGSNGDSGDAGGDGDGGGGGGFARGGDVKGGMLGENFSNWFGDSHVVEPKISSRDKSPNKPMVVYHGTPADISEFNPVGMGKVSHTFGDYETTRHGMFFAEDPEFASSFAQANTGGYKRPGANVLPVHLSIQNPLYIEPHGISEEDVSKLTQQGISEKWARNLGHPDYTWEAFDGDDGKFFVDALKAAGYDGVRYHETDPETKEAQRAWVAFNPTQIKSAIGNAGSYDPSDANITRADGGEIVPQRDLGADPTVQRAMDVTAPFSVSNPMSVFPKPQRMWEDQRPGGAYLAMPTKEDITGHKAAQAEIGVNPGGKPFFNVSRDAVEETGSPGRGSATVKTNLFKQKAGWQWAQAPEGHEDTNTLVSINHRGKHHYALNAQFPKGVDLARYENAPSEPRLRPTTKGNVELGEQVGTIMVRGKEHPVYRNAIVRNAGGAVGYADGGMPGDDPVVQQAMDITRQAQADQPSTAGTMQLAQAVTAPGRRRFEIAPARVAPATISDRPRDLPEEGSVTIKRLTDAFKKAIDNHLALPPAEQIANARQAENNVAQYVGRGKTGKINSVLTANKKLMKAQTAGEDDSPLTLPDGRTLEMTGLALMPDYREGQFKMCGNSDVCRDLCLGKESGQYRYDPTATQAQMPTTKEQLAAAGGKPRMAAFRRTMAMMRDPESFAVYLHELIDGAKIMAEKRGSHLGVRLNVLSDLSPKIMEPIIKAHPDVSFYDYTKMNYDPVADNHHYTYSSTGLSQPDRGVENPFSNWRKARDRLDQGHNVAMAFAHGKSDAFPEHLHDEETGKKYRVVSGDEHDFRPMDMVPEGEDGVIIALKNMAASNSEYKYENAARNSHGFFVHHEPDFERTPKGTFAVDQEGNRIPRNKVYTVPVQPMKRGAMRPQEN